MTVGSASAKKYASSAFLVPGVERQVHEPRAQAGEVERERLPAFVGLHGDAIADPGTGVDQRVGDARRERVQVVVMDHRAARNQDAGLFGVLREMIAQQRVQVRVHAVQRRATIVLPNNECSGFAAP